ncbi:MAG: hypothetical protein HOO99_18690 [Hyphomicrobiaceae bacterium]|nr:hypothetical protein [Hyphomicrobiaceae bacterium]
MLTHWRQDYNAVRPRSALANQTPEVFHVYTKPLAMTADQGQKFCPPLSL